MTEHLWVFAGPNGAGKSTFIERHVRGRIPIVNPDEIARGLPQPASPTAILQAGRIALAERQAHLSAGRSFGIETTLTGHAAIGLIRRAREAGYRVSLVFVGLNRAGLSASRVRSRVLSGGHDVPSADVMRRFDRSLANLTVALPIAHRAFVFDNSGTRPRLLFSREHGRTKHLVQPLPPWAAAAIPAAMQQHRSLRPDR